MHYLLTTLNSKYIHPNLAIRLLYDLNKDIADLSWHEFTIKENQHEIAQFCSRFDMVCFSCYIWNISQTIEVCTLIKQLHPEIKILLGGPEVSYEWENVIALDTVDFIITGEGEIPFSRFLQDYPDVTNIPNVVSKLNSEITLKNETANFDLKLYDNRNPYFYDTIETLKNKVLYIETSRGCPYKCEFCLASLDNVVRYLPMETIKSQLLFLMQHGKVIKFLDRTFNIKRDFTLAIFQFILDHHQQGTVFQFEITADILHPDIIRFIQEKVPKDLFRFEIGIQSVNTKANLSVSRKQNFEKTKNIIRQIENYVELHLDLIVGLPFDYIEDIHYGFDEVFKLFAPELQLGFLKLLKGTPVREKYAEHAFVYSPLPPYQLIESKFLSKLEMEKILMVEEGLEIYWNKKRLPKTLKYVATQYSAFDFLFGLGERFLQKHKDSNYTLKEIFYSAFAYIQEKYSSDTILVQLFAIDYLLHYKVKPETEWLLEHLHNWNYSTSKIIQNGSAKTRTISLETYFDWTIFTAENTIIEKREKLHFHYSGTNACLLEIGK